MCLHKYIAGKMFLRIFVFFASIIFLSSSCFAESTKPSSLYDDLIGLLDKNQTENRQLLLNWSDYLVRVKGHSNEEFLLVIENLTREFASLKFSWTGLKICFSFKDNQVLKKRG